MRLARRPARPGPRPDPAAARPDRGGCAECRSGRLGPDRLGVPVADLAQPWRTAPDRAARADPPGRGHRVLPGGDGAWPGPGSSGLASENHQWVATTTRAAGTCWSGWRLGSRCHPRAARHLRSPVVLERLEQRPQHGPAARAHGASGEVASPAGGAATGCGNWPSGSTRTTRGARRGGSAPPRRTPAAGAGHGPGARPGVAGRAGRVGEAASRR